MTLSDLSPETLPGLTAAQRQALYEQARREAMALRRQAIADAAQALARATQAAGRRLRAAMQRVATPHRADAGSPVPRRAHAQEAAPCPR